MSQQHFLSSSGTKRSDYWISTLGGTGDDYAESIAIDSSDNLYISGRTDTDGAGLDDVLIAKYDPLFGINRWQRTLGGTSNDISESIAVDGSGNIYILGRTASTGQGDNDYLISKYNSLGVIQWQRSLGGTGSEFGRAITVNGSDVYITGQTSSTDSTGIDLIVAKYNTSGTLQWQRTFGGTGTDRGYGVAVDNSGDVYVVGSTDTVGSGSSDALILKYNSSGSLQWKRILGGASSDTAWAVAVDSSNNAYVAIQSNFDFVTVKYDSTGALQWQLSLGGTGTELPRSITVNGSDIYVCGYTSSEGAGSNDVLIAKYNTSGFFAWQRRLGGTGSDIGYGVAVDSSGDVYFTGKTRSEGSGLDDVLIAKIPADGSLTGTYGSFTYAVATLSPGLGTLTETSSPFLFSTVTSIGSNHWIGALGGQRDLYRDYNYGYAVAVDGSGNSYVSGYSFDGNTGNADGLIAKYNSSGTLISTFALGTTTVEIWDMEVDSSNNLYLCGANYEEGAGSADALIAKYNSSGTLQWQRIFGKSSGDFGYDIAIDSTNVYVAGKTGNDISVTKYNTSGTFQWSRALTSNIDRGNGVAFDSSGNIYVTGEIQSKDISLSRVMTITKYNSSGDIQWIRTLEDTNVQVGFGIQVDNTSSNIYVCGVQNSGTNTQSAVIAKYNTSGTLQWQRDLSGGFSRVSAYDLKLDSSNNVYICGETNSTSSDVLIAKYNTSGTLQWQRYIHDNNDNRIEAFALDLDNSGNLYVGGFTSESVGWDDYFIAKLPDDGSLTGTYGNYTYGDPSLTPATSTLTSSTISSSQYINKTIDRIGSNHWIMSLGQGTTQNVGEGIGYYTDFFIFAAGYTDLPGDGTDHGIIVRVTSAGVLSWARTLGVSADFDKIRGLATRSNGDNYVVGDTDPTSPSGSRDILIAKYNSGGGVQWQRRLGSTDSGGGTEYEDIGYGVAVDSSGNAYVAGTWGSGSGSSSSFAIAKYDFSGTLQWQRTLGSPSDSNGYAIAVDGSGNSYIAGSNFSTALEMIILKYNSSGTLQWQRKLGGSGIGSGDTAYGVAVDSSGNVYITGSTGAQGSGASSVHTAKYNSSGTLQWQRNLSGTGTDLGIDIAVDSSANVYVVGRTSSSGQGFNDILIVKYNSSGTIQWQNTLGGSSGSESANKITVDNAGNIYITGEETWNTAGNYNGFLIAKLADDGTGTGTYGSATYASSSLTDAPGTLSSGTSTLTSFSSISFSESTPTLNVEDLYLHLIDDVTTQTSTLATTSVNGSLSDAPSALTDSSSALTDDTCNLSATRTSIYFRT